MSTIRSIGATAALAVFALSRPSPACTPCGGWWDIGHYDDVCGPPYPSSKLLKDWRKCVCGASGACASACGAWCASLSACEAGSDPTCAATGSTDACDMCVNGKRPYVGAGCAVQSLACFGDHTQCVTCSAWVAGGDVQGLCPTYGGVPDSETPAWALSVCACAGACSQQCLSSCTPGYLDTSAIGAGCSSCLQDVQQGCGSKYGTCAAQ